MVLFKTLILFMGWNSTAFDNTTSTKYQSVDSLRSTDRFMTAENPEITNEPILEHSESRESASDIFVSKSKVDLTPFLLPTPNQENAGSCLFMTLTGSVEWWLARLNPEISRELDGPLDLSERYLMNLYDTVPPALRKDWETDLIYMVNHTNGFARNQDYRYAKGHYTRKKGEYQEGDSRDSYGTNYNWINDLPNYSGPLTPVPRLERRVILNKPNTDRWDVTVAPSNINEKIKKALRENQAPVEIIYNHYGIWHAVMIVGYDDNAPSEGCKFTNQFPKKMQAKAKKFWRKYRRTKANKWKKKARYYESAAKKVKKYLRRNPCRSKGMFYVRDSVYRDKQNPYDYDLSKPGTEGHYSKKVVLRDYSWPKALSNRVFQIYPK